MKKVRLVLTCISDKNISDSWTREYVTGCFEGDVWKCIGSNLLDAYIPGRMYVSASEIDSETPKAKVKEIGTATLEIIERGKYTEDDGTEKPSMFVKNIDNRIFLEESDYDPAYLVCVHFESNNNKFYHLKPDNKNHVIDASWGRNSAVKVAGKVPFAGNLRVPYPSYMFWIKYFEKISKGYTDLTEVYLKSDEHSSPKKSDVIGLDVPSLELIGKLKSCAQYVVDNRLSTSRITEKQIELAKTAFADLSNSTTVEEFNKFQELLIKVTQYNASNIRNVKVDDKNDFSHQIDFWENIVQPMMGVVDKENDRSRSYIETADDEMVSVVKSMMSEKQFAEVRNVYSVKSPADKRFNSYASKNKHVKGKYYWHGSNSGNWISIIRNSLLINTNPAHGTMLGNGVYFAPDYDKSRGYTDIIGSRWNNGKDSVAYIGLFEVLADPYVINENRKIIQYTSSYLHSKSHNSVLALCKNTWLRKDELCVFDADAYRLVAILEIGI